MRLVTSAVMATLALTLSACGGDDPPPPEPSTTATTVTEPPPTVPPRAGDDSPQGVTDFVSYYLKVLSYAHWTGQTAELSRLSDPGCDACQSYITAIQDLAEAGGQITGGARTFQGAKGGYVRDGESLVTIDMKIAEGTRREDRSSEPESVSASEMRLTFGVTGSADGRRVTAIYRGDAK
ncbi:hypothetical protein IDH50_14950 [Aeromicrobium tamlense]|uniref:DUF6318 domain-containing protein n=1 Tax=Aeromicrobium tamlense TaxID=375541 RepID=A0A8I0KP68_9ACTN|nr:DUF6318 family protein [Aeromicrobium tamlense]MBD1270329.1 hypothetical protein [Aeromicrobium tamlense]MBD1271539.1 hypothetical protein [Aeromicrobium tamlense]NYI37715.1 hypothetical protein [Aeromicrobium tamlense]